MRKWRCWTVRPTPKPFTVFTLTLPIYRKHSDGLIDLTVKKDKAVMPLFPMIFMTNFMTRNVIITGNNHYTAK